MHFTRSRPFHLKHLPFFFFFTLIVSFPPTVIQSKCSCKQALEVTSLKGLLICHLYLWSESTCVYVSKAGES